MSKKQHIGTIILVVMILGFIFYWYEYRPSQIKKKCSIEAQDHAIDLTKTRAEMREEYKEGAERGLYLRDDYEQIYKKCLREKGL